MRRFWRKTGTPQRQRRKVGLALGGGAARGLAHIGVLEVLEREGIPIDMIAGTSIGALIGALYAQGKGIKEMKDLAIKLSSKRAFSWIDPALPKTGLVRGRKIEDTLRSIIGDIRFEDLKIPFACVATDLDNGEEVVIKQGLVWEGVRASGSIPVVLAVTRWEGRNLVDGGLVNAVPVSVVREMGADFVVAVNVMPNPGARGTTEPNIFTVIMQTFHISSYSVIKSSLDSADVAIEPQMGNFNFTDFHRVKELIAQGELAAQEAIPKIRAAI